MIGHIDGSAETTTRSFDVVLDEGASVELDDLVVAMSDGPVGPVAHYGIVTECSSSLEGATFPSDTLRIAGTKTMPGALSRTAQVTVLRADPEVWISPRAGAPVELAIGDARDRALFVDQMDPDKRLPIGFDRRLEPVYVDFTFINGEKGGHVSISGISGVATKTSYALFLLYQLFETERGVRLLGDARTNTRALVFNVKGEDLLHLDRPNVKFAAQAQGAEQWRAVGVEEPGYFRSVGFFAPIALGLDNDAKGTDVQSRDSKDIHAFGWTPYTFIRKGLLRFAFTDARDARTQVSYVEESVRLQLLRWAHPCSTHPGAAVMIDPGIEGIPRTWDAAFARHRQPREAGEGRLVRAFGDLVEFIDTKLDVDPIPAEWAGRTAVGSVLAFLRRLAAVSRRLGHLVRTNVDAFTLSSDVNVVDLHALHEDAQRFIVGALLDEIFEQKQKAGREPLRFIVLDELNKYAPKNDTSPIKDLLVDIAARGRSLGVILIGAQQSAANVEPAIIENAAVKIVGRLDASSAEAYRFLGPELRERATRFLPGTMVVDQPLVPAPIPMRFPFPSYATNQNDARDPRRLDAPDTLSARSRELI
jgi:DNA helicase HerA-like ATPase